MIVVRFTPNDTASASIADPSRYAPTRSSMVVLEQSPLDRV